MNNFLCKHLTAFLIVFFISAISKGQIVESFVPKADVFVKYDSPRFGEAITKRVKDPDTGFKNMYIVCYFVIDSSGKIQEETYSPLIGVGNKFNYNDSIWRDGIDSIKAVSKKWVFKPRGWKFEDKGVEEKVNSKAITRPNFGRQLHLLIFEISGTELTSFGQLYFIKE